MKNKSNSHVAGKIVGAGVGIAAIAAAAAGAYYLYGSSKGKSNRRAVKSWMLKAKADVMDEMEKMKEVNEGAYHEVIAKVANKYKAIKDMDQAELAGLVTSLKSHWKDIKGEIHKATKATKAEVKHVVRAAKASKK